jgi:GNAT superfamily N-acetyltransferase
MRDSRGPRAQGNPDCRLLASCTRGCSKGIIQISRAKENAEQNSPRFECGCIQEKNTPEKLQVPGKRRTGGKLIGDWTEEQGVRGGHLLKVKNPGGRNSNERMRLSFTIATQEDAPILAALHTAVAEELTRRYGRGPWSVVTTERGVLFGMRHSRVVVARRGKNIVGTMHLPTKKPWAIDVSYFLKVKKALYLTNMAVLPSMQRQGIGRQLMEEAVKVARAWPADAIRLDAFDAEAGAGPFYAKCRFREVGRVTYRKAPLVYFELVL